MKTKIIGLAMIAMFVIATGFTQKSDLNLNAALTSCPNNPSVNVTTDNASYIRATALLRGGADGYEWTVSGGFIISGQGTNQISMGKDCPSGYIEACVRAYNYLPGGGICYSAEVCGGVLYTGPCFF